MRSLCPFTLNDALNGPHKSKGEEEGGIKAFGLTQERGSTLHDQD